MAWSSRSALLLLCLLAGACSPVVYAPTPHQTPFLEGAGDTRATVVMGTGLRGGEGVDLAVQAAHAPLPHVFVHGTLQQSLRSEQLQSFGEAGLGVWLPLHHGLTAEVLGGYGWGRTQAESTFPHLPRSSPVEVRGTLERLYGQVNVGLATRLDPAAVSRPVPGRVGAALRLSHVRGSDFQWNLLGDPEPLRGTYFEPAVFVRMGEGPLQFQGQIGLSLALLHHGRYDYDAQHVYGSFGMSIDVNQLLLD